MIQSNKQDDLIIVAVPMHEYTNVIHKHHARERGGSAHLNTVLVVCET